MTDVAKWYHDEQLFLQENRTKSGGNTAYLPGLQLRFTNKTVIAQEDLISWNDWRQAVRKWHRKLAKCLVDCIESGEFMHVYNTIIVLKEILPVFPVSSVYEFSGLNLSRAMDKFVEKEERGDLKILGRAYVAIPCLFYVSADCPLQVLRQPEEARGPVGSTFTSQGKAYCDTIPLLVV